MNKIGLYFHIPFCRQKCHYCDFYSLTDLSLCEAYEKALCEDLLLAKEPLSAYLVDTVYFGGGTPSLLSPNGLGRILKMLREELTLSRDCEITLECNPESTTEKILSAAKAGGVGRLSFGMQSALDTELSAIGRLHRAEDTERAVLLARKNGFENISLDLMYGLPGQTLSTFRESLERAVSLGAVHLSFYCLTLSPGVALYAQRETLPQEEETREMYLFARNFLAEKEFFTYEISNAAKEGFFSRHNLRYWNGEEYLGFGPGAHSFFRGERFRVKEGVREYLSGRLTDPFCRIADRERILTEDRRTEYIMLSLRKTEGIDCSVLRSLSDEQFCQKTEEKFVLWCRHGLCVKTPRGYALTPEGAFVSNEMISQLI